MSRNNFNGTTTHDLLSPSVSTGQEQIVRQRRLKRFTPVKDIRARYKSFQIKKRK